jgi:hypothetical protein
MNDPRRLKVPHRSSPPNHRATAYNLNRQQQRAAAYSTYNGYEYDYDTVPAGGGYLRGSMETPRSHPTPYSNTMPQPRRPSVSGQQQRMPFGEAAAHLHAILSESRAFYENFLGSFNRDIEGVKGFAGQMALEALWKDKIKATTNLRYPDAPGQHGTGFNSICKNLVDGLYNAANAGPRRPPNPKAGAPGQPPRDVDEDAGSLIRLVKKLQGQYQDLCELVQGSKKSPRATADLIKDINLLLQVLDGTRNLWERGQECPPDFAAHGASWSEDSRY